jgi:hypothetical protein
LKDIKIIPAGFAGLVISEGFGKLSFLDGVIEIRHYPYNDL